MASDPAHEPHGAAGKVPALRVRVSPAAETAIRAGHPWVYGDSVRDQNRQGLPGDLAIIFDRKDRFMAAGLYDPDSPLRIRTLHVGKPTTIDAEFWRNRLAAAWEKRKLLFEQDTDGYRLVNGESDGFPALIIDRYGSAFVVKLYSAAWLGSISRAPASGSNKALPGLDLTRWIEGFAAKLPGVQPDVFRVVLRLSRNIQPAAERCGLVDGQNLSGRDSSPSVLFHETGLCFEAEVVQGQKTGFFLDQRENRRRIESLASGAEVLNAFSFSGGFSLYAARGGAHSVTDIDISPHALAAARRNFALNRTHPSVAAARHQSIQADVFEWLERGPGQSHELVILDPPSLAKREAERAGAIRAYERLAASGVRRVRRGGVLLCASCSAHVGEDEFFGAVRRTLRSSGRRFSEIETADHASDHPATFPEARYLKAIYLRIES